MTLARVILAGVSRRGLEYDRHELLSLYSALNTQTGELLAETRTRRTSSWRPTLAVGSTTSQSTLAGSTKSRFGFKIQCEVISRRVFTSARVLERKFMCYIHMR
jgi:hypothetical protein